MKILPNNQLKQDCCTTVCIFLLIGITISLIYGGFGFFSGMFVGMSFPIWVRGWTTIDSFDIVK